MSKYESLKQKCDELNKYIEINSEKITKAYNCCCSNPCSVVSNNVSSLISKITSELGKASGWDDSAKETLDNGIDTYIKSLGTINESISSSWSTAEKIYKSNFEILGQMRALTDKIQTKLSSYPKRDDFRKIRFNIETGDKEVTYNGYEEALKTWEDGCDALLIDVTDKISKVDENFHKLDSINGTGVAVKTNVDLGGLSVVSNTYDGVKIALYNEEEVEDFLSNPNNQQKINLNRDCYAVRYSQSKNTTWDQYGEQHGVDLSARGCSLLSFAAALTKVYSEKEGRLVLITPQNVIDGFNAYFNKHGGSMSDVVKVGTGWMGGEKACAIVSEVWGVDVVYDPSGFSKTDLKGVLAGNGATVYSRKDAHHLNAALEMNDADGIIISGTRGNESGWLNGIEASIAPNHKESYAISLGEYESIDGNIYDKNGNLILNNKVMYVNGKKV